jgi:hypothetical protein
MKNNTMKRITTGSLLIAASILLLSLQPSAVAQTFDECKADIDLLIADTSTVTLTANNADKARADLLVKLQRAEVKLSQAKFLDAIQALKDYEAQVNELLNPKGNSSTPGISSADAARLISEADSALTCIRAMCGC